MVANDDVTSLVAAAARGDRAAWNGIVERYLPLVYSVTRAHRLGDKDAEDVNQTVWLRLVEHLDSIREPRALPKWIMVTAKHESLRLIRARHREVVIDPMVDRGVDGVVDGGVEADLLRAERHQALRDALAELSDGDRRLLLLLVADPPVSYREISAILGIPVGSIGPTRARCLERLRATPTMRAFLAGESAEDLREGGRGGRQRAAQRR